MRATSVVLFVLTALVIGTCVPAGAVMYTAWEQEDYGAGWTFQQTDWNVNLNFNQFDTMGGLYVLLWVEWDLRADVQATARYENTDNDPHNVHMELWATCTWYKPGGATQFSQLIPTVTQDDTCTGNDGTMDFDGPSGGTFPGLVNYLLDSGVVLPADPTFGAFQGSGTMNLNARAYGGSQTTGGGNIVTSHTNYARMRGRLRYAYDYIPEPGTSALMLCGLAAVGLLRRRRRA